MNKISKEELFQILCGVRSDVITRPESKGNMPSNLKQKRGKEKRAWEIHHDDVCHYSRKEKHVK